MRAYLVYGIYRNGFPVTILLIVLSFTQCVSRPVPPSPPILTASHSFFVLLFPETYAND